MMKVIDSYEVQAGKVNVGVQIIDDEQEFVRQYVLDVPEYGMGTKAMLENLKNSIVSETAIQTEKMIDPKFMEELKQKFRERAEKIISKELPKIEEKTKSTLIGMLLNEMLGLGKLEFLLADKNLEEMVVNSSREPVWVYHKKFGWLKTNVNISSETEIQNYANIIARRVGKQITILEPLVDAHLITGDRANATLFPISGKGNTITIRRFRRDPWTVTDFIENKTANSEVMSLVWLSIQFELNILISGGTASGKTSLLNVCMPFIQPNHRILSIEDTRELALPDFLHWVPLTTRQPNPEGKGEVSMLDLLVNSLRMRPDRVIVGEVRRQREAEVMFEAMHTGHSVYTTVHANTADETIRRLTNPPVNIPTTMLDSVHLNIVMFRNRRVGARRILQIAEFLSEKRGEEEERIKPNILYRWHPINDEIGKHSDSIRLFDELALHTGFSHNEINDDLKEKKLVLEWMLKQNIRNVQSVGKVIAEYYKDKNEITSLASRNKKPEFLREEKEEKIE